MLRPAAKRSSVLRDLARRIQEIETGRRPQGRLAIALPAFDEFLPEGGLPAGSLVEVLSAADGGGAWTLALLMTRRAADERGVLVVVDKARCFYPPAAAGLGLDLQRVILVHPKTQQDVLAAVNLSLRCEAVGGVIASCERLDSLEFRRLQLAAEAGGGVGFLLRGPAAKRAASFATLRLWVEPIASATPARRLRIKLLRCRDGAFLPSPLGGEGAGERDTRNIPPHPQPLSPKWRGEKILNVEIDNETGDVRVLPGMAAATTPARAKRA